MRRPILKAAGWAALLLLALAGGSYSVRGLADLWLWIPLGLGLLCGGAWTWAFRAELREFMGSRRGRQGGLSLVYTASVLVFLGLAQSLLKNSELSWDLSANKAFTLSDEMVKTVKGLGAPVRLLAFYGAENRGAFEDLLQRVKRINPSKLDYEFVDMNRTPLLARQYGVRSLGTTVLVSGEKKETVGGASEEELLNALIRLGSGPPKPVYFLAGHQERSLDEGQEPGLARLKASLESSGFKVAPLNLAAAQGGVPADASALVLAGPRRDVPPSELALLDRYLAGGGRILVAMDPPHIAPPLPPMGGLKAWLAKSGLSLGEDLVVEMNLQYRMQGGSEYAPLVLDFSAEHPATKNLAELQGQAIFPLARTVNLASALPAGASGAVLASSMPTAFAWTGSGPRAPQRPGPQDRKGPLSLMAALEAPASLYGKEAKAEAKARLVVVGTASLLSNQGLGAVNNLDLLVNSLRWLANEENRIALAPKSRGAQLLLLDAGRLSLIRLSAVLLCLGALIAAFLVWQSRQRSA